MIKDTLWAAKVHKNAPNWSTR